MPRDQKLRRGNEDNDDDDDDNDHDNYDAAVAPIASSVLSLFFWHLATLTVLHRCSSTLHMTKRRTRTEQDRSIFLNYITRQTAKKRLRQATPIYRP